MPRIVVVPGLAVRRYLEPAVDRLRSQGADVRLYRPPAWSGRESVEQLSRELADDLSGAPVDLLVGLSVGTYVAAGAAAVAPANQRAIVLVSPVEANSWRALGADWLRAARGETPAFLLQQAREWLATPPRRLAQTLRSTRERDIEAGARAARAAGVRVHVVHGERDPLSGDALARRLADGQRVTIPRAGHSWPYHDPGGFARTMLGLA